MSKCSFTPADIKAKLLESDLKIVCQFVLMKRGKWIGIERHVCREWEEKSRTMIKGKDGKRHANTTVTEKKAIFIIHKTPAGLLYNLQGYRRPPYEMTDEKIVDGWHPIFESTYIFDGIEHDKKILITGANINALVNDLYKIMQSWHWELLGKKFTAGKGMREFDVRAVGRDEVYDEDGFELDISSIKKWKVIK